MKISLIILLFFIFFITIYGENLPITVKKDLKICLKENQKMYGKYKSRNKHKTKINKKPYFSQIKKVKKDINALKKYYKRKGIVVNNTFFTSQEALLDNLYHLLKTDKKNCFYFFSYHGDFIDMLKLLINQIDFFENYREEKNFHRINILKEKENVENILNRKEYRQTVRSNNPIKAKITAFLYKIFKKLHLKVNEDKFVKIVEKTGNALILIFTAVLIFFIIKPYLFLKLSTKNKKDDKFRSKKMLDKRNLYEKYKECIKGGNLKNALRFYYLYLLAILEEMNYLYFENFLTDREYIELLKKRIKSKDSSIFEKIVLFYERKWYGKEELVKTDVGKFTDNIDTFIKLLNEKSE